MAVPVSRGVLLWLNASRGLLDSASGRPVSWSKAEQSIFESVILDFVITTNRSFEIQKVEVSEN
jgi:hypothetical protein